MIGYGNPVAFQGESVTYFHRGRTTMISVTSNVPGDTTEELFDTDKAFDAFDHVVGLMEEALSDFDDAAEDDGDEESQNAIAQFEDAIDETLSLPFDESTIPFERTVELSSGERYEYRVDFA
jgi:hypothetical protein